MKRWKRISMQDAHIRVRNFTLVDFLSVLAVLVAVVLIKPQFENIQRRAQGNSPSSLSEKANEAPILLPRVESETLLLSKR